MSPETFAVVYLVAMVAAGFAIAAAFIGADLYYRWKESSWQ